MMETVWQVLLCLCTAAIGWLFSKLKTKRENKQTDLQIINEAIKPLLSSISELTEHVNRVTNDLIDEKKRNLELMNERTTLRNEIGGLTEKIALLEKKVGSLTKLIQRQQKENNEKTDGTSIG